MPDRHLNKGFVFPWISCYFGSMFPFTTCFEPSEHSGPFSFFFTRLAREAQSQVFTSTLSEKRRFATSCVKPDARLTRPGLRSFHICSRLCFWFFFLDNTSKKLKILVLLQNEQFARTDQIETICHEASNQKS